MISVLSFRVCILIDNVKRKPVGALYSVSYESTSTG